MALKSDTWIMKTVNEHLLKKLVKGLGEDGIAKTSIDAQLSIGTLEKMMAGSYKHTPGRALRARLSSYFNVAEAELFPTVATGKRKSA